MDDLLKALSDVHLRLEGMLRIKGTLGSIDPSTGNVTFDVPGRPGYVWVQPVYGGSKMAAFNDGAPLLPNAPVVVAYDYVTHIWKVEGVNTALSPTYAGANNTPIVSGAPQSVGQGTGRNPLIPSNLFLPGLVTPSLVSPLSISIYQFNYVWNGQKYFFPTTEFDLTPYIPASANTHGWVLVGVDPTNNTVTALAGATYPLATTLTQATVNLVSFTNKLPLFAVAMYNGQTSLSNTEGTNGNPGTFADCRPILAFDNSYVETIGVQAPIINVGTALNPIIGLSIPLALQYGGSAADLHLTGGAHKVLMQETVGGAFTVRTLTTADLPITYYQTIQNNSSALTQEPIVNYIPGTNITLTIADNPGSTRTDITINSTASGNVVGPGSSTDHAIARWDGTAGTLLEDSPGTIVDDSGNLTATTITGLLKDAGTTNTPDVLTLAHRTSGTPTTGFGTELRFQADSASNVLTTLATMSASYANSATTIAQLKISVATIQAFLANTGTHTYIVGDGGVAGITELTGDSQVNLGNGYSWSSGNGYITNNSNKMQFHVGGLGYQISNASNSCVFQPDGTNTSITIDTRDANTGSIINPLVVQHSLTTANAAVNNVGTNVILKAPIDNSAIGATVQVASLYASIPIVANAAWTGQSIWSVSDQTGERKVLTLNATRTRGYAQTLAGTQTTNKAAIGGSLFDHFVDAGNITTTETDLYSDSTAGNTLVTTGDTIVAVYSGIFVLSATATRELKAYFGGTLIFDSTALTSTVAAEWVMNVIIVMDSSTSVRCAVTLTLSGASVTSEANYQAVTGLTLTGSNILKITGQAGGVGAATNDIVAKLGKIEWKSAV